VVKPDRTPFELGVKLGLLMASNSATDGTLLKAAESFGPTLLTSISHSPNLASSFTIIQLTLIE
jgi:hypothetical protein